MTPLRCEVIAQSESLQGTARYVQCEHKVPRVVSEEAMRRFPHYRSCMRCATVRLGDERLCKMHAGFALLERATERGEG